MVGNELAIKPDLSIALTGKVMSNDDIMSVLEARYRKKMTKEIEEVEQKRTALYDERSKAAKEYEMIVNATIDEWYVENYDLIFKMVELSGIDTEGVTVDDFQWESRFEFGHFLHGDDQTTSCGGKRIRLVLSLWSGKLQGERVDEDMPPIFMFAKVLLLPEQHWDKLSKLYKEYKTLNAQWSEMYNEVYNLKKEKDDAKYAVDKFRGELMDDMLSKWDDGMATQTFLDGVVDKIRAE